MSLLADFFYLEFQREWFKNCNAQFNVMLFTLYVCRETLY